MFDRTPEFDGGEKLLSVEEWERILSDAILELEEDLRERDETEKPSPFPSVPPPKGGNHVG